MGVLKFGPARVPSRESPELAIELLQERAHSTCEIDFEGTFWMDYPWAARFGELAREADRVHASPCTTVATPRDEDAGLLPQPRQRRSTPELRKRLKKSGKAIERAEDRVSILIREWEAAEQELEAFLKRPVCRLPYLRRHTSPTGG